MEDEMDDHPKTDMIRTPAPAKRQRFDLTASTFAEAQEIAKTLAGSSLVPNAYQGKPRDIFVAIQMGAEVGLSPMASLIGIAVVNGKPTLYGDALIGVVRGSGVCKRIVESFDKETETATCYAVRTDGQSREVSFSRADAEQAKLWGKKTRSGGDTPWITNPTRMLQMRARAFCLRDLFADVLGGFRVYEEARDDIIEGEVVVTHTPAGDLNERLVPSGDALRGLHVVEESEKVVEEDASPPREGGEPASEDQAPEKPAERPEEVEEYPEEAPPAAEESVEAPEATQGDSEATPAEEDVGPDSAALLADLKRLREAASDATDLDERAVLADELTEIEAAASGFRRGSRVRNDLANAIADTKRALDLDSA